MFLIFSFFQLLSSTEAPILPTSFRSEIASALGVLLQESQTLDRKAPEISQLKSFLEQSKGGLPSGISKQDQTLFSILAQKSHEGTLDANTLKKVKKILQEFALLIRILRIEDLRSDSLQANQEEAQSLLNDLYRTLWLQETFIESLPLFSKTWLMQNPMTTLAVFDDDDDLVARLAPTMVFVLGVAIYYAYHFINFRLSRWMVTPPETAPFNFSNTTNTTLPLDPANTTLPIALNFASGMGRHLLQMTPTPETVLDIVNSTEIRQALMALLSTQTPLAGCSAAATEAMRLLKQAGISAGNFLCTLQLLAQQQLNGSCTYWVSPTTISPVDGVVCEKDGSNLAPGSLSLAIVNSGSAPYVRFRHTPLSETLISTTLRPTTTTPPSTTLAPTTLAPTTPELTTSASSTTTPSTSTSVTPTTLIPTTTPLSTTLAPTTLAPTTPELTTSASSTTTPSTSTSAAPTTLIPTTPEPTGVRQIYWISGLRLCFARVNDSTPNVTSAFTLVQGNNTFLSSPSGLFADPRNRRVYFGDYSYSHTSPGGVYVGNFDPDINTSLTGIKALTEGGQFSGVFLDTKSRRVYYSGWCITMASTDINPLAPSILNLTNQTKISGYTNRDWPCNGGSFWWADNGFVDDTYGVIYWSKGGNPLMVARFSDPQRTSIKNSTAITSYNVVGFSVDPDRGIVYFTNGTTPLQIYAGYINNRSTPTKLDNISTIAVDRAGLGFGGNIFVV